MIKLTYTNEMIHQDWLRAEDEQEQSAQDLQDMKRLHETIISEAVEKGYKDSADTFIYDDNEVITDVIPSYEEQITKGEEILAYGACKDLIYRLEYELNKDTHKDLYSKKDYFSSLKSRQRKTNRDKILSEILLDEIKYIDRSKTPVIKALIEKELKDIEEKEKILLEYYS